jgi:hypothetical protein
MPKNEIEMAQQVIDDLTRKHRELADKAEEMAAQRRELSYAAHTGDAAAMKKLTLLTRDTATLALERENIASALVEANKRLNEAQAAEALEQEREQAKRRRDAAKRLKAAALKADTAAAQWVAAVREMRAAVDEIHLTRSTFPTDQQFTVVGQTATNTVLMAMPFRPEVHVPPQDRHSYRHIADNWAGVLEREIKIVLGEAKQDAA